MRIITETKLKDYAEAHPDAKTALQEWSRIVGRMAVVCRYKKILQQR